MDNVNTTTKKEKLDAQKIIEKFIYSCSHDLRAPISTIQGLVRIADYYPNHEETHKCMEMIEACTQKMDKMIRSLEEYMVNAQRQIQREEIDGNELIEQVVDEYEEQLTEKGITVLRELHMSAPWVTDRHSAYQIVKHLFANAVIFSDGEKKEKKIMVRIQATRYNSSIEVVDNGLGIADGDQEKIFDVFFRGSSQSQGMGMGLFLVNHLTQKIKAKLTFNSIPKMGSCFRVNIPNY
jgi:signal transduction histidine kinase